ncbi:unnamed protein product [Agarophyton chilense]
MVQSCRPSLLEHRQQLEDALQELHDPVAPPAPLLTYCAAVDHYLQLPALLDPIIPAHVSALCNLLEQRLSTHLPPPPSSPQEALTAPSRALYALLKVRGIKNVSASFPHEPSCLQEAVDHACAALSNTGPISTAAALFLARLIARSDASELRDHLIKWAVSHTLRPSALSQVRAAGLSFLAVTFKHAPREYVHQFLPAVLEAVEGIVTDEIAASTIEAHLIAKLTQRLALTFLPPLPLSWRYVRHTRNLFSAAGHTGKLDPLPVPSLTESDAEALEVVIDLLLSALRHRDTVVRWSAAKGVARITARLPTTLAFDVVESVMQLFEERSEAQADAALHGACLALAELVRRGLILPDNDLFSKAFDAVRVAASFDMRRGANSVGAYVRDAACYTVWAIARAYERQHVAPFADVISESMIPLALLDREVNCRRAAAAALQECVGRLSEQLFDDGIQLITMADYFSLGDKNAAYTEIAQKVAMLANGKHFNCILREIWKRKLVHWDSSIRSLAAKSLARMVDVDNKGLIVHQVIPHLVEVATQRGDMVYRHGSILGLAELSKAVGFRGMAPYSSEVRQIPQLLEEKRLLSGRTGDDTRVACCRLIEGLAIGASDVYLASEEGRKDARSNLVFLERVLGCGKENMYGPAASAYFAICNHVVASDNEWHATVTREILHGISASEFYESQRGFALAAGVCGNSPCLDDVIIVLCHELGKNVDVEVRRNCAISVGRLTHSVLSRHFVTAMKALQSGMQDYAKDERGDVGSWVREESMKSASEVLAKVLHFRRSDHKTFCSQEELELKGAIQCVCEQCCSRIDRTRAVAGAALETICRLCSSDLFGEDVQNLTLKISSVLSFTNGETGLQDTPKVVEFREARTIFSRMKETLFIPDIFEPVLRGFVAAGGAPGQQSKHAAKALTMFFSAARDSGDKFMKTVLQLIDEKDERLTLPALRLIEALLDLDGLRDFDVSTLLCVARSVKRSWRRRLGDVKRVLAAVGVLSELATLSEVEGSFDFREGSLCRECLEGLGIVLGGPIPRLRRVSAEAMYLILLELKTDVYGVDETTSDGEMRVKIQQSLDLLTETVWENMDLKEARTHRNILCDLLGIKAPVISKSRQ